MPMSIPTGPLFAPSSAYQIPKNSAEWLSQQSLSKNLSLKDESPLQTCQNAKHLSLEIQGQDSSSSQSVGQSHHDAGASGGDNSHDLSSESGQDETYGKHAESQMKPLFHMANPDFALNPSQVDGGHSMGCIPYPYSDPYFCGGLFPSYGQPAIIPPQMLGVAPARVPLPLDLADDGPIYVNAKQYHGILRRRQSRAKLEAQNKLIKARKPYLHESRHIHAINRVRGSGGRFLSTKKLQQTEGAPTSGILGSLDSHFLPQGMHSSQFASHRSEIGHMASDTPYCNLGGFSNSSQPDYQFRGISPGMGGDMRGSSSSGLVSNGARSCASVVR